MKEDLLDIMRKALLTKPLKVYVKKGEDGKYEYTSEPHSLKTGKSEDYGIDAMKYASDFLNEKQYVFYVNENKKTVVLKIYNSNFWLDSEKAVKIKCHPEDKFDAEIGIGLAISHVNKSANFKYMRELLRNKKGVLDYQKYAKYCLASFFGFNLKKKDEFLKGQEIKLDFLATAKIVVM